MELQEAIQRRRSVRHYKDQPVEKEKINEMIQAAVLAPSWKNSQVSRYYVVTGAEMLEKIRAALPEFNRNNVADAPVLIVTSIFLNYSGFEKDRTPVNELGNGWGYYDCGLQNMNLLLKAEELGLSTLVMGIRDADKIREALGMPETEAVVSVIGVGYSDAEPRMPERRSVEEITKFFE